MESTKARHRRYFRCGQCLGVWTVDLDGAVTVDAIRKAPCPLCDAPARQHEDLGRVHSAFSSVLMLETGEMRCKCDGRCIGATGPACDCVCQGENHGKGIAACYAVETENGTVRGRMRAAPKSQAKARERAAEWTAAQAELQAMAEPLRAERNRLWQRKRESGWLPAGDYSRERDLSDALRGLSACGNAKTHAGRMKKAAACALALKKTPARESW